MSDPDHLISATRYAAIERCAQVAETAIPGHWASVVIAAAIRKLNDEPKNDPPHEPISQHVFDVMYDWVKNGTPR